MTETMAAVKTVLWNPSETGHCYGWPSERVAAREAAKHVEGCELIPWAGENVVSIDGEVFEIVWMNRKRTAMIVREAVAPEF